MNQMNMKNTRWEKREKLWVNYMGVRRSLISTTEGMVSFGYTLATSWIKVSYLSKNSFCNQTIICQMLLSIFWSQWMNINSLLFLGFDCIQSGRKKSRSSMKNQQTPWNGWAKPRSLSNLETEKWSRLKRISWIDQPKVRKCLIIRMVLAMYIAKASIRKKLWFKTIYY